nr:DivIVA domain-containing protein [Arthrobacter sp. 147(2020)]
MVAIAVLGAVAFALVGGRRPGGQDTTPDDGFAGLVEPTPSLPSVLLPDEPDAADVGAIRFAPALRGYRMDQVDEVLDRLAAALEERDTTIAELRQARQDHP